MGFVLRMRGSRTAKILLAAMTTFALLLVAVDSAVAQETRKPRTLFDLLFNNDKPKPKKEKAPVRRRSSNTAHTETKPDIPEKSETARTVLVFGDFTATALGEGLEKAFETSPGVIVETRTKGASGLVREDYYDWKVQFPALIDELKPVAAVISIGGNDRQEMNVGDNEYKFRSEEWLAIYKDRIETIMKAARDRHVPLFWTGLPSFKSNSFTTDMVTLNAMYRQAAEKGSATYVDIWDGFVDEDGKFIFSGSDIDGQQVRLRTSDGLNFTKAGKRKQAFYVEKYLRRLLGDAASENFAYIPDSNLPELQFLPPSNNLQMVRTDPIAITDPSLDGGDTLLGGPAPPLPDASPLNRLLKNGYTGPETAGRADNYQPEVELQ